MKLRSWLKQNWLVLVVFGVLAVAIALEPARAGKSVVIGLQTFISVGAILLTVFVFMGMFSVWVSEDQVARHLGKESGVKGLIYGAALGTIYHGFFSVFDSSPTVMVWKMFAISIKMGISTRQRFPSTHLFTSFNKKRVCWWILIRASVSSIFPYHCLPPCK